MRRPYLILSATALLLAPLAAQAFETVDTMPYASGGRFPAYAPDEIRPYEVFIEGGLMYDSNILRRNAGAERELVQRYGAGGRIDQRIWGRQAPLAKKSSVVIMRLTARCTSLSSARRCVRP